MIVTSIFAGLGNQLFQYAIGRCLANKLNTELKLDVPAKKGTTNYLATYKLNAFNVQENFATDEEIQNLPVVKEIKTTFTPEIMDSPDNVFLSGYWQSEKYFTDIEDIIRREFTLKNPLGKNSAAWKEKILSANCAVSLHVRHGDYLMYISRGVRGLLTVDYYRKCVEELKKIYGDITLFAFSDDLQWCKDNFKFDVPINFVEGCEHDYEEMYLMSLCKHNIISNGTFAWWGAWLNQNPGKKVFAPYPWHINGWGGETIIPQSWIKVPVDYSLWAPILSIIVYVENNLSTINLSLFSVLNQLNKDSEIILIDASTDGSGKICKNFAGDNRVTVLKVDSQTDKFSAWNKALSVVRGDYVLFLTAKDFIFPYTANILVGICDQALNKYANSRETYMTYNTYENYTPNIISSTQSLEEDEDGAIGVNGIANKKFSLKVDAAFQNLNGVAELSIPNSQKLVALGTKGINNNISTKFFKRKFLMENKIRFNEKSNVDAELLFLVNAFCATEKITFVPQVFLGQLN